MKRIFCGFILIFNFVAISAQQDSIYINAKVSETKRQLSVNQEITYYNKTSSAISQIKLLNWISAYQNRKTPLLKRKLEDRKSDLFFSKQQELGSLEHLNLKINDQPIEGFDPSEENIYLPLAEKLKPGEKVVLEINYKVNLPDLKFTGYGSDGKKLALKYFFLVPDGFENENQSPKKFIDIEENQSPGNYLREFFSGCVFISGSS
jgi:hypothetical protein